MSLFKPLKGNSSNLPEKLTEGWAYFCTDTGEFFIDYKDTDGELKRKQLNALDAKTLLGCSVEQALSGLQDKIPSSAAVRDALTDKIQEHNTAADAHQDIRDAIPVVPTNISEFVNDAGYVDKEDAQEAVLVELGALATKDAVEVSDLPAELQGALTAKGLLKGADNGIQTAEADVDYATPAYVKSYADGVKDDLLNGAGAAYDTLKELGDLIDQNHDAIDALETVAASKVSVDELSAQLGGHNAAADAHQDIRKELAEQKTAGLYIPVVQATSTDGCNYTGTLDGVDELTNGLLIVMRPLVENTSSDTITFNLNGFGAMPLARVGVMGGKQLGRSDTTVEGPYAFGRSLNTRVLLRYTDTLYDVGSWIMVEYPLINADDVNVSIKEATTRENVNSGENLKVLFGKVKKWFSDLGTMAFKSAVAKDDMTDDVQAILDKADNAQPQITASGILKSDGSGNVSAAVAGTDYATAEQITEHNEATDAHQDIREELQTIDASIMLKKQTIVPQFPSSQNWYAVAYGNGVFVATTSTDKAAYSTDGMTWTEVDIPVLGTWYDVVYGKDKFVMINKGGFNCCYSQDGITWTSARMPKTASWASVAYGNDRFVAVATGSGAYETSTVAAYSLDGITWAEATLPADIPWRSVTYGAGIFVALGLSSSSAYSTDGITWTINTLASYGNWGRTVYGGGRFVAIGDSNTNTNIVMTSTDGITWTQSTLPSNRAHSSIAYGNGVYVVTTSSWTEVSYSTDGITWNTTSAATYGYQVCYGGNKFIITPTSSDLTISYSYDGVAWLDSYSVDKVQLSDLSEDIQEKLIDGVYTVDEITALYNAV